MYKKMFELPDIYASSPYGKFFGLQSHLANVDHAMEFGTENEGCGAIWLANQKSNLHISTIGRVESDTAIASRNIKNAGLANRITVTKAGDIQKLSQSHEANLSHASKGVGFSYIDADRPDLSADFEMAVRLSNPGACILVDNVMKQTYKENAASPMQVANKAHLIKQIGRDQRVDGTLMQVFGPSGIDGYFMMKVL